MSLLIGWCLFAAAVLIVSLVVHASTFLGIDPMAQWPGVMFIHLAIFPPFIAAICYANRIGGPKEGNVDPVIQSAPRWLQIISGVFFVYAIVNFAIFMILIEGGNPHERDGKYVLQSHGKYIRELTEEEYHRAQAYVVRGFSGHWMAFSSAALMILAGAAKLRRDRAAIATPPEQAVAPVATTDLTDFLEQAAAEPQPEPTTARAGWVSLMLYLGCLAMILSSRPVLSVAAALPLTAGAMLALRRRRGFPHRSFESCIGCLTVFPNGLFASWMGWMVAEFLYLALYAGLGAAISHEVAVTFPEEGPAQLSNGELLNNQVWAGLMLFVTFPLFAVGTLGLSYLAEHVGRLVEVRRRD